MKNQCTHRFAEPLAESIPSLRIAAISNIVKAIGEKHREDGKGSYEKYSLAQIDKWACTTDSTMHDRLHYIRLHSRHQSYQQFICVI